MAATAQPAAMYHGCFGTTPFVKSNHSCTRRNAPTNGFIYAISCASVASLLSSVEATSAITIVNERLRKNHSSHFGVSRAIL